MPLFKGSGVLLLSVLAGALFIGSPAFAQTAPFTDDFESYTVDQSVVGQGDWTGASDAFQVVNASSSNGTACESGAQCLFSNGYGRWATRIGSTVRQGSWDVALKLPSAPSTNVYEPTGYTGFMSLLSPYGDAQVATIYPGSAPETFSLHQNNGATLFDNLSPGTWHTVTLSWDIASTSCNILVDVDHSGHPVASYPGAPTRPDHCWPDIGFPADSPPDGVGGIGFVRTSLFTAWYLDDLKPTVLPPEAHPTLANLAQFQEDGTTAIAPGAGFVGNSVLLAADVAEPGSGAAALQVELKPSDQPFDGTNLSTSATTTASGSALATTTLSVTIPELIPTADQYQPNGNHKAFHWRARVVDASGVGSAWQNFGPMTLPQTDLKANVVPLYTQVKSDYPIRTPAQEWADQNYASGTDYQCGNRDENYHATIHSCGCALSSLVMLSRFYNVDTGIDGTNVDPLAMNNWLVHNHGYDASNNIRWPKALTYLGTYVLGNATATPFALGTVTNPNGTQSEQIYDHTFVDRYMAASSSPVIAYDDKTTSGHFLVLAAALGTPSSPLHTVRDPAWYNTKTLHDARASYVHDYQNTYTFARVIKRLDNLRLVGQYVEFRLASPADILVTDSQGRHAGLDPRTGQGYAEIPWATYDYDDPIAAADPSNDTDMLADPARVHRVKVLTVPDLPDGTYTVQVIGTGTGSYTFTSAFTAKDGSTAESVFVASTTPDQVTTYQVSVQNGSQTVVHDTTPPEASITFSTSTKVIQITGTDDRSVPAVVTAATKSTITDAAGNTLTLDIAKQVTHSNYAALILPSFEYSSGTTTVATTSLRYFWATDAAGKFTLLISAIKTPTDRLLTIYTPLTGKTYVVSTLPSDDDGDLSLQSALLLLRKRLKTYTGLYVPSIATKAGTVIIQ